MKLGIRGMKFPIRGRELAGKQPEKVATKLRQSWQNTACFTRTWARYGYSGRAAGIAPTYENRRERAFPARVSRSERYPLDTRTLYAGLAVIVKRLVSSDNRAGIARRVSGTRRRRYPPPNPLGGNRPLAVLARRGVIGKQVNSEKPEMKGKNERQK